MYAQPSCRSINFNSTPSEHHLFAWRQEIQGFHPRHGFGHEGLGEVKAAVALIRSAHFGSARHRAKVVL
jgi:hypothetical protein